MTLSPNRFNLFKVKFGHKTGGFIEGTKIKIILIFRN